MMRISQITGEFSERTDELQYRESCWGEWSARYRTASVVGAVFYVLGFAVDYISVEDQGALPALLALRCLFAAVCVAEGFGLRASSYRPSLDCVVLLVMIACSVFTDVIIAMSPGGVGQHTLTIVALLLIFYTFIPNRTSFTVFGALFASASFIATGLFFFEPSRNEIASATLHLGLANVLGVVVATATQRLGRMQYKGLAVERNVNRRLRDEIKIRKLAQKEAYEAAKRYKRLVELSPEGIVVHRDGRVLYANPAALDLIGVQKAEDFLHTDVTRFVHPEYREKTAEKIELLKKSEEKVPPVDIQLVRYGGQTIDCDVVSGWTTYEGRLAIQSIFRDITERKRLEKELKKLAETDFLTGAFNRRKFMEASAKEYERADRYGRPLSVMVMDLDFFKKINDTYGHAVGDMALIHFVDHCLKRSRMHDIFGRIGGEEFAMTLPETELAAAMAAAKRLGKIPPFDTRIDEYGRLAFTVSVGVAQCVVGEENFQETLIRADQALYVAKQQGRNRAVAADRPPKG